jgi:hypothetical protein
MVVRKEKEEENPCKKYGLGTHPSKVQGKREHEWTQTREKTKANNEPKKN